MARCLFVVGILKNMKDHIEGMFTSEAQDGHHMDTGLDLDIDLGIAHELESGHYVKSVQFNMIKSKGQ